MKFVSWLLSLLIFFAAVSFALANQHGVSVNLWPFGVEMSAPLYLLTLGPLFLGILIGSGIGWFNTIPHRMEARRLKKDIAGLREKISDLQHAGLPQRRKQDKTRATWKFWEKRA